MEIVIWLSVALSGLAGLGFGVRQLIEFAPPKTKKIGIVDSIRRHLSSASWVRRLRSVGVEEEKIKKFLLEAAKNDLQ
jgi:hypothetical protein